MSTSNTPASTATPLREPLKCGVCFKLDGRPIYATVCHIYQHRELAKREIDRERRTK